MDIQWSKDLIKDLINIVSYLKKNKIGIVLEHLGNYFIKKHSEIENYTMEFSEEIDPSIISEGEYKLAFICEIINSQSDRSKTFSLINKKKSMVRKIKRKKGFENVYIAFSIMLRFCIGNLFKLNSIKSNYKTFYLTTILKDILFPERKIKNKEDPQLDILILPFFITKEIMKICRTDSNMLYLNTSLILETENLNLNILTIEQRRNILEILETKKTIYLRILLVLSFEISKIENIINPLWLLRTISFENYEQFVSKITSPLIETLIFISSFKSINP